MPALIRQLYRVVAQLEAEFGRKFTPDGHLVGSIGEVIGAATVAWGTRRACRYR